MLYLIPAVPRSGNMKVCYPIKQKRSHRLFPPLWRKTLHAVVDKYDGDTFYSHTNVVWPEGGDIELQVTDTRRWNVLFMDC